MLRITSITHGRSSPNTFTRYLSSASLLEGERSLGSHLRLQQALPQGSYIPYSTQHSPTPNRHSISSHRPRLLFCFIACRAFLAIYEPFLCALDLVDFPYRFVYFRSVVVALSLLLCPNVPATFCPPDTASIGSLGVHTNSLSSVQQSTFELYF